MTGSAEFPAGTGLILPTIFAAGAHFCDQSVSRLGFQRRSGRFMGAIRGSPLEYPAAAELPGILVRAVGWGCEGVGLGGGGCSGWEA